MKKEINKKPINCWENHS